MWRAPRRLFCLPVRGILCCSVVKQLRLRPALPLAGFPVAASFDSRSGCRGADSLSTTTSSCARSSSSSSSGVVLVRPDGRAKAMGNAGSSGGGKSALTPEQLARLQRQFQRLANGNPSATIQDLQRLPELAGNPLVPRIFQIIDANGDGSLTQQEFIDCIQLFAGLSSDEELYDFAFMVYDQDNDGLVSAEELFELLQQILGASYTDHQVQQVVQATMRQYAKTHPSGWKLTIEEFEQLADAAELRSKLNIRL